jgi:hypothetical protein
VRKYRHSAARGEILKRVVDKSFVVRAPLEVAWNHLAQIEAWPSWAKHIRSVVKSPPGPLSGDTHGTLQLTNGVRSTFRMVEFEPPRHWKWAGSFLRSQILYDHIFSEDKQNQTTIRFTVVGRPYLSAEFSDGFIGGTSSVRCRC